MDILTIPLLTFAVLVFGSILIKGIRDHARGWGGGVEPPIREKPAADQPAPGRSGTASSAEIDHARKRTPPA